MTIMVEKRRSLMNKPPACVKPHGLTENELRARHDNMYKIRAGCKKLQRNIYLTDQQMREACCIPANMWRGFSDNTEFDKFKIRMSGGLIYWGLPECVKKLKEDLNVS